MKPIGTQIQTRIQQLYQKFSRTSVLGLAAAVTLVVSVVVAHAAQSLGRPTPAFLTYSLAPGASSAAITPKTGQAVHLMGTCTTVNDWGVGSVTLFSNGVDPKSIRWIGGELGGGTAALTAGNSSTPGTHIMQVSYSPWVNVQVNSATTICIR